MTRAAALRRPVFLSRCAVTSARLAGLVGHLPTRHDQDDHAGIDADEVFPDPFEILASKRAGGHYVALFADTDNSFGHGDGAHHVAVRMFEGGSKTWDEETISESLCVPVGKVDATGEAMNKAADETLSFVDTHGKVTSEDDDNRPAEYENGPLLVSRELTGSYTVYGYHDRYGDRGAEGSRFIVISDDAAGDPTPTWDENLTIIDARKVKFVVDGMKSMRDEAPSARVNDLPVNFPGQPRDPDGQFSDGFMSEAASAAVKDLVDMVSEIETRGVEPQRLYGGQSAETLMFDLGDSRKIVRKRAPEWGDPDAPKNAADAEQLGSLVADALGVRTARVYRADKETTYMEFVSGDVLGNGSDRVSWDDLPSPDRMGLLDVLISNPDRNSGNIVVSGDTLIGIDHGSSWFGPQMVADSSRDDDRERYSQVIYGLGPMYDDDRFPNSRFAVADSDGRHWIDNPLTPADVETARARLEVLRPDFARLGRTDWLEYSLRALDEIAPHAKGTVSIFDD